MKTFITLAIFTLGSVCQTWAQQIPMVNQYFYTPFIYNPAFAGASGNTNAFLVHRTQWAGIPDAPITNAFNFEGSIQNNKAGFGLSLYQDRTGILNEVGGFGSYSYRVKVNEDHHFLLGLGVGVVSKRVDFDKIIVKDQYDTYLLAQMQSKAAFDGNAGFVYNWKDLNIGVSLQQLMASRLNYENDNDVSMYMRNTRHMLASASYDFHLMEDDITLSPMFLLRYAPGAPIQYEGTVFAKYKDFIGLGVSYKSDYAVSLNAMVKPHARLTVGYSYDLMINDMRAYAKTSHEFTLGYTFNSKNNKAMERIIALESRVDTLEMNSAATDTKLGEHDTRIGINEIEIEGLKGDLDNTNKANGELTEEVERLKKEIEELKKSGVMPSDPGTDPGTNPGTNPVTNPEEGVKIGLSEDYFDLQGNALKKGNYVIVGVFANESNATKYRAKLNSSIVILNKKTTLHYVYTFYSIDNAPVYPELKEARGDITDEAWILRLK
ncbi:MAG: type IX secretion system PorP/SprF family membrane protein [Crocinitomicaceae bacterium]|jgi:type IX secretion system PorP/SprF family membrane protein